MAEKLVLLLAPSINPWRLELKLSNNATKYPILLNLFPKSWKLGCNVQFDGQEEKYLKK